MLTNSNSICPICQANLIATSTDFLCSFNPKHYALLNNRRLFIRPIGTLPLQIVLDYSTNQTKIGLWSLETLEDDTRAMSSVLTLPYLANWEKITQETTLNDLLEER